MTGNIKWFSTRKGYGFIDGDNGEEIFLHYSNIEGEGFKSMREGERVEYEVGNSPDGRKEAKNCRSISA